MRCVVTFVFGPAQTLEIPVHVDTSAPVASDGRAWLDDSWARLDCEPTRVSGKVLLLDKILGVTEALGYAQLSQDQDQTYELAMHIATVLKKPVITVDLVEQMVGF